MSRGCFEAKTAGLSRGYVTILALWQNMKKTIWNDGQSLNG